MKRITTRLPDSLAAALEERAFEENRKVSSLIRLILSQELGLPYFEIQELDEATNPELPLT